MKYHPTATGRLYQEAVATERFLTTLSDESFADLFHAFTPALIAFYRARGCPLFLAEDLSQEVMLTVHRRVEQIRDHALFSRWFYKIARNTLYRHYDKLSREVETVAMVDQTENLPAGRQTYGGEPAFEFNRWIALLNSREREIMTLRFVEEWEYHEIATAQAIPIGTVQWRIFNAKKKLAPHLAIPRNLVSKAA